MHLLIRVDFERNKINDIVCVTCGDVCKDGFSITLADGTCDAVFLDLPCPWLALDSAHRVLKGNSGHGGRLCSFSPCIEQVQRTCDKLRALQFVDIITVECLLRPYEVLPQDVAKFTPLVASSQQAPAGSDATTRKRDRDTLEQHVNDTDKMEVVESEQSVGTESNNTNNNNKKKGNKVQYEQPRRALTITPISEIRGHTGYLTFATKYTPILKQQQQQEHQEQSQNPEQKEQQNVNQS
jgi:tRNA (adenine57-N1/adenine58-N1)-methyltransferase